MAKNLSDMLSSYPYGCQQTRLSSKPETSALRRAVRAYRPVAER